MTNDELKSKIVKVLQELRASKPIVPNDYGLQIISCTTDREIADALIAAGIGDVSEYKKRRVFVEKPPIPTDDFYVLPNTPPTIKQLYDGEEVEQIVKEREEYKHRAEVAERALRNAATRLQCRGGLGKGFCRVDKCNYYHCNNDDGCIKAHLEQAEKELVEESKDEQS